MRVNIENMTYLLISLFLLLSSCSLLSTKNDISVKRSMSPSVSLGENKTGKFQAQKRVASRSLKQSQKRALTKSPYQKVSRNKKKVGKVRPTHAKAVRSASPAKPTQGARVSVPLQVQAAPQSKKISLKTVTPSAKDVGKNAMALESQKQTLQLMQAAYDQASGAEFVKLYEQLKKISNLDRSIASQGHYLAGLFYYATKTYGASIQSFDSVLRLEGLPQSDQVKAIFGKAQTFKKMNIPEQSVQLFQEIISQYPSSYEASRAAVELQKIRSQF